MSANNFMSMGYALKHWANERPNAIAVEFENREINYKTFAVWAANFTNYLQSSGIQRDSIVAPIIKNSLISLLASVAIESLGAIRVAQIEDQKISEVCDFIVTDYEGYASDTRKIDVSWEKIGGSILSIDSNANIPLLDFCPHPKDTCFISATSGTTGEKKYFVDIYGALWENLSLMQSLYFQNGINTFICFYPIGVGATYAGCSISFNIGGRVVFGTFQNLTDILLRHHRTHTVLTLNDIQMMKDRFSVMNLPSKISTLRVVGSNLPDSIRNWVKNNLAVSVHNTYSSNETGQIGEVLQGGVTKIYSNVQVKIVDDNWDDLGTNEIGFITVKSNQLISKYIWNEQLNRIHFRDGWFRTSDVGKLISVDELLVLDRADNIMNLKGIKVAPAPIEIEIKKIEGISDAVVLDVIQANELPVVVACITVSSSFNSKKSNGLILQILKENIFSLCPVYIAQLDKLPRNDAGKVIRATLKNLLQQSFQNKVHA